MNSGLELLIAADRPRGGNRQAARESSDRRAGQEQTADRRLRLAALRMVVEADSQRFHGDWERAAADRERDQLLSLVGWRCHRFVRDRLVMAPEESAERLRGLAAARRTEVEGGYV